MKERRVHVYTCSPVAREWFDPEGVLFAAWGHPGKVRLLDCPLEVTLREPNQSENTGGQHPPLWHDYTMRTGTCLLKLVAVAGVSLLRNIHLSNSLLLFSKFMKKGNIKDCCDKKKEKLSISPLNRHFANAMLN